MPAGVSWTTYMKFFTAAMLSMLAGSQLVHMYYHPLDDMNVLVEAEVKKLKEEYFRSLEKQSSSLET